MSSGYRAGFELATSTLPPDALRTFEVLFDDLKLRNLMCRFFNAEHLIDDEEAHRAIRDVASMVEWDGLTALEFWRVNGELQEVNQ